MFEVGGFRRTTLWRVVVPLRDLVWSRLGQRLTDAARAALNPSVRAAGCRRPTAKSLEQAAPAAARGARAVADAVLGVVRRVSWHRLAWTTKVGSGDAARTAILAGSLWALKGGVVAVARRYLRLAPGQPEVRVVADFDRAGLVSSVEGIGVVRVGHIMLALPGLAAGYLDLWRARRRASGGHRPRPAPGRRGDRSGRRNPWPTTPSRA
ncbi:MAG: DUF2953 domain-containing protein [Firmicutes bacterium]|nr:DUF2953 domain-containing protein [Bacillota bacterium]